MRIAYISLRRVVPNARFALPNGQGFNILGVKNAVAGDIFL